jgi:hypothetical protein
MISSPSDKLHFIGVDGKLRKMPYYMKDELLKQGWAIVSNPKQEYYPQYDRTVKGYEIPNTEIAGDEDKNFLEVDKI